MNDDLVIRLKRADGIGACLSGDAQFVKAICNEAATALTEARAEIERLRGERDEARGIVRDTYWMAVRYADGRMSYAPGMCNRAIQKAYDAGWLTYHDHKQHDHDPQYAREGDRPEYRSIEDRAIAAESELSTLRARVREVVGPFAAQSECWPSIPDNQAMMTSNGEDLSAIDFPMSSLRAARQLMEEVK